MGLFSKKNCSVCGSKIGMLGNRKLEDGNLCKDCASGLSPWFSDRRHSTVADIESQLADRKENLQRVASFTAGKEMGLGSNRLFVDETKGQFAVCTERDWKDKNPDVLPLSAITSCITNREEHRVEKKRKDSSGNMVSYNPPQYEYSYDFYCELGLDHAYIDEIRFRVNDVTLKEGGLMGLGFQGKMNEVERICSEIEIFMNSTRFQQPSQSGALEIQLPEQVLPYKATEEDGYYGVVIKLEGSVLYSVKDAEEYERIPGNKEDYLVTEVRNTVGRTLLYFKNAGLSGKKLLEQKDAFIEKLCENFKCGALALYGVEIVGTDIRMSVDEGTNPLQQGQTGDEQMAARKILEQQMLMQKAATQAREAQEMSAPSANADWQCPNCGAVNSSRFCSNCGSPRA